MPNKRRMPLSSDIVLVDHGTQTPLGLVQKITLVAEVDSFLVHAKWETNIDKQRCECAGTVMGLYWEFEGPYPAEIPRLVIEVEQQTAAIR